MSASLNIIETNPFKHLVHLSLKLREGNDSDVKKYLADCIKSVKVSDASNFVYKMHASSVVFFFQLFVLSKK